ncbi:unnamed protein product [Vitrella brassicaformis CCMP3155]|uniref:Uncharacterized protein n=1 Tax=Vitrella brassicaformis (strain CCMP3155) TaxID=1169540 RepID=A0A0G4EIX1_VITBC|nr:unnamed protein product [Vitrella brassicaformis CCMP3155]|eukprot:CEL95944.1 unnamed protein product [Vitrella brassicaformis CCMP3155]
MPWRYAAVRTGGRVWHTPHLRVLTFGWIYRDGDLHLDLHRLEGTSRWVETCGRLEKLDEDTTSVSDKQGLLSKAPSLPSLQSIGHIDLRGASSGTVAALRETLVSRGCRKHLRDLHFWAPYIDRADSLTKEVLLEVGSLVEAVMQPQALEQLTVTKPCGECHMDLALIGWMVDKSRQVQDIVRKLAAIADVVWYNGGQLTSTNGVADPNIFPRVRTFACDPSQIDARAPLSQDTLDCLAQAVAKQMPKCRHFRFRALDDAPFSVAVSFLEALQGQLGGGEGGGEGETVFESVTITTSVSRIVEHSRHLLQEWATHDLPTIKEVTVHVIGYLPPGVAVDDFFGRLLGMLVAIIRSPAVPKAAVMWPQVVIQTPGLRPVAVSPSRSLRDELESQFRGGSVVVTSLLSDAPYTKRRRHIRQHIGLSIETRT